MPEEKNYQKENNFTPQTEKQEIKVVHNYKDSVFVDLFGRCKDAKENFLSLYNAITGKNLKAETTEVKPMMLEQTIYTGRYNDVSMLVDGHLIVMVEQQSTINENMPLRFLEYLTKTYEKLIPSTDRYLYKTVPLPTPEFYVIYNGTNNYPAEKILRLSDAFRLNKKNLRNENISIELSVKVYNISRGKEIRKLMECIPLAGFARLIELVNKYKAEEVPNPVDKAIQQCIKENVLSDYFKSNSTEVRNMLIAEYNYEDDIAARKKEAKAEGINQKMEQVILKMLEKDYSLEDIIQITGASKEKVNKMKEKLMCVK